MIIFFKILAIIVFILSALSAILPRFMDETSIADKVICLSLSAICAAYLIFF